MTTRPESTNSPTASRSSAFNASASTETASMLLRCRMFQGIDDAPAVHYDLHARRGCAQVEHGYRQRLLDGCDRARRGHTGQLAGDGRGQQRLIELHDHGRIKSTGHRCPVRGHPFGQRSGPDAGRRRCPRRLLGADARPCEGRFGFDGRGRPGRQSRRGREGRRRCRSSCTPPSPAPAHRLPAGSRATGPGWSPSLLAKAAIQDRVREAGFPTGRSSSRASSWRTSFPPWVRVPARHRGRPGDPAAALTAAVPGRGRRHRRGRRRGHHRTGAVRPGRTGVRERLLDDEGDRRSPLPRSGRRADRAGHDRGGGDSPPGCPRWALSQSSVNAHPQPARPESHGPSVSR